MNWRFVPTLLSAAFFLTSLVAQDCPREKAESRPAAIHNGPPGNCSGIEYEVGGIRLTSKTVACPTFVVFIPPHDHAVASDKDTYAHVTGTLPITMIKFECQREYLIIIPLGLQCVAGATQSIGYVRLIETRPCPVAQS
ncbi:MAG: hypothetical protein U1F60_11810 [Planctomycetota bacterium]